MSLQFVNSEKGKPRLLLNGFLYFRDRDHNESTYWRCVLPRREHCPGRVITRNDEVLNETPHNHGGQADVVAKEILMNTMKDTARTSTASGHEIIAKASTSISAAVVSKMPSTSSIKRTLRNVRNNQEDYPPHPSSREKIVLPRNMCETEKKENFLIYDKGSVEDRILIFGTEQNLELLATSAHWFADGTFDACPALFDQLYTIHAIIEGKIVPMIFALLPGKSQAVYTEMLQELKNLKSTLNPSTVMIDMERAAAQAFQDMFPEIAIRFCNFHFKQAVYRKVQSYNLKTRYDTEVEFAKNIKLLTALAFVPIEMVEVLFDRIIDEVFVDPDKDTDDFLFSFEEQYIGRTDRRGNRRAGKFPIKFWNHYEACQADLPRTNNNIEGWHRGFNELIKAKKPTLWHLISSLKIEQSRNEMTIVQIRNAIPGAPQAKKVKNYNERLLAIVQNFESPIYANKIEYIKAIANCISL